MRKSLGLVITATMAFAFIGPVAGAQAATIVNPVTFDSTVSPLPGNLPSQGVQATQTAEFGDLVRLGTSNQSLHSATVTMSDWAL